LAISLRAAGVRDSARALPPIALDSSLLDMQAPRIGLCLHPILIASLHASILIFNLLAFSDLEILKLNDSA
jgi:hypothetical protein